MELEDHIRGSVLDQDHLADLLVGFESQAALIQARVASLIEQGLVELYTYPPEGGIVMLSREDALGVVDRIASWTWQSHADARNYFLSPVRLAGGALAYG
jgi:hypothetical protein